MPRPRPAEGQPDQATKPAAPRTERLLAGLMAGITLVVGIAARSGALPPAIAKPAGVALWCALVYWAVVFLQPRLALPTVCITAIAVGWCVELLQLTPLPARLASEFPASRWVLGRAFHAADLPAYAAGGLLAFGLHAGARRWLRSPPLFTVHRRSE